MRSEAAPGPSLVENYLGVPEGLSGQRLLEVGCNTCGRLRHTGQPSNDHRRSCNEPPPHKPSISISSMKVWAICRAVEGRARGEGALV